MWKNLLLKLNVKSILGRRQVKRYQKRGSKVSFRSIDGLVDRVELVDGGRGGLGGGLGYLCPDDPVSVSHPDAFPEMRNIWMQWSANSFTY